MTYLLLAWDRLSPKTGGEPVPRLNCYHNYHYNKLIMWKLWFYCLCCYWSNSRFSDFLTMMRHIHINKCIFVNFGGNMIYTLKYARCSKPFLFLSKFRNVVVFFIILFVCWTHQFHFRVLIVLLFSFSGLPWPLLQTYLIRPSCPLVFKAYVGWC